MENNTTNQTESQKENKYKSGDEVAKNIETNLPVMPPLPSDEIMDSHIQFAMWWRMWYGHPKVGTDCYNGYKTWANAKRGNVA